MILPTDQAARVRALEELDTNFIVEAGAGSGKTTLMAGRVVAMIAAGRPAEKIAAVTFTKKAAAELRERVELVLESQGLEAGLANEPFIGTIHSFCARLLRERPIEAGLDPRFREVEEDEAELIRSGWWEQWLERLFLADDTAILELRALGISPRDLGDAFGAFVRYPDVDFSAPECPLPKTAALVKALNALIDRGLAMIPVEEPAGQWDKVQKTLFRLNFERRSRDWNNPVDFFDSLSLLSASATVTQNRWERSPETAKTDKAAAKAYGEELSAWRAGAAEAALTAWYEHRYAPIARLLRRATDEFAAHRLHRAQLTFEDLLTHTARLLRENPDARRSLGERWRYLLVDEFQDTDPIQAEVAFLLGSEPTTGESGRWADVSLRSGALFVVGDPKQSIYRFRRADIETYEEARTAIERQGAMLRLTANFRSVPVIAEFVNTHFGAHGAFPTQASAVQAAFSPLEPMKSGEGLIARYSVLGAKGESGKDVVLLQDAQRVASFIADGIAAGRFAPQDVLVLTQKKAALTEHARQLAARGIAVSVAGASLPMEAELYELHLLFQLLRDPENGVLVAAVLEGRFFGASPADLWAAKEAGLAFTIAHTPAAVTGDERAVRVSDALTMLHDWLVRSRADAPDVFLARVLDGTGLLAYTAADDLGDVRAGLLVRLIEDVRAASLDPELAHDAAFGALDRLLAAEIPDAPLLPGRTDAVRVMNLHKAKGLEAPIVILAAPTEASNYPPSVAVRREGSRPTGGVLIEASTNEYQSVTIAQPPGWEAMQATEAQFQNAERERLRYVAATRAGEQLVVAEFEKELKDGWKKATNREWSAFAATLDDVLAEQLDMEIAPASGREQLTDSAAAIGAEVARVEQSRADAARASWTWQTVAVMAKAEAQERRSLDDVSVMTRGAGAAWGTAVHRMLDEVGKGGDAFDVASAAQRIAADEGVSERAADLIATVERALASEVWTALRAAPDRRFEWPVVGWLERDGSPIYIEGVIDAAYETAAGWHIIDWKTDDVADDVWVVRLEAYEGQVALYAELLARATGRTITTEIVRLR